jgi:hypothetical protein
VGRGRIPMKFPKFPLSQEVPNSTSILSHTVWPQFNFHVSKVKRSAEEKHVHASIFRWEAYLGFYVGECLMFQKKLVMGSFSIETKTMTHPAI